MRRTMVLVACLSGLGALLGGCVSNPGGPKLKEPYAAIRPAYPVSIKQVDRVSSLDHRIDYSTYAGPNWVHGDIRVTPGSHRVDVEFSDSRKYIGSDKALVEVREGLRYYIGMGDNPFYMFPEVVKVEPIEGYWDEHKR